MSYGPRPQAVDYHAERVKRRIKESPEFAAAYERAREALRAAPATQWPDFKHLPSDPTRD